MSDENMVNNRIARARSKTRSDKNPQVTYIFSLKLFEAIISSKISPNSQIALSFIVASLVVVPVVADDVVDAVVVVVVVVVVGCWAANE